MAFTQVDIDAIDERIKQARRTRYKSPAGERESENQDLDQLMAARLKMLAEVNKGPTHRLVSTSRGYRK